MAAPVKGKNVFAIFTIMTAPVTIAQTALTTVFVSNTQKKSTGLNPLWNL